MNKQNKGLNIIAIRLNEAIEKSHKIRDAAHLSRVTGISKPSLSQYLNGVVKPKQDRVYLMATALEVSPSWLMGIDAQMDQFNSVSDEDKEILEWTYRNKLHQHKFIKMDDEKEALKVFLNSFGYDLNLDSNGYSLLSDYGFTKISEMELNNLINSTKEYLEFNARKFAYETSGWNDGTLKVTKKEEKE